jgi:hypothetical protein
MKSQVSIQLYILLSCLFLHINVYGFTGYSFFRPRPQEIDAARELVGWQRLINQSCMNEFYGALSVTPLYSRSFQPKKIAEFLFGCPLMVVSGSRFPNRGPHDILADNFGLPTDYKSLICFEPHISNFILDLDFYFGLDHIVPGLYVRLDGPITNSSWDLHLREFIKDPGTAFYPAGYFGPARIDRDELARSFSDYICEGVMVGDLKEKLHFGKICERLDANFIAGITAAVGYNFTGPDYHAGLNFRLIFPTGNHPKAEFLFEPIAGNARQWQVGIGFTSHYDFWQSCDELEKYSVYLDINMLHVCKARLKRSYDFIANGPGSRYMLLEQILPPSTNLFLSGPGVMAAPNQYRSFLVPAINKTTLDSHISIDIEADLALKFTYQRQGLDVDIGYGFYGRSKEKLHCRQLFESNRFAIKGDTQVYGFDTTLDLTVPLNATQSKATLHAGQGSGNANFANLNVDSPIDAADSTNFLQQLTTQDATDLAIPEMTVQTSDPAILLADSDINEKSALLPHSLTHKLFFHVGHVWFSDEVGQRFDPFIGFGTEIEFAGPTICSNSGYNQWQVWAKGGIGF